MRPFFGCPPFGGRTTVFNNNYYSMPSMMGCNCQSNIFNKMSTMFMMSAFMQNMFRPMTQCNYYPQQGYYPGLYLSGGGTEGAGGASSSSSEQNLKNLQDFYGDCRFSSITENGVTRYYCSTPDGSVYTDTSLTDLQKQLEINGVKPKQKQEQPERTSPDSQDGSGTDPADDKPITPSAPTTPTTPPEDGSNPISDKPEQVDNKTNRRRVHVPENWIKLSDGFITTHYTAQKNKPDNLDQFISKLTQPSSYTKLDMTQLDNNKKSILRQDLIKYNPSCFNNDGSINDTFDWKKLDIPSTEALKADPYNLPEKTNNEPSKPDPKTLRTKAADDPNRTIVRSVTTPTETKLVWSNSCYIYKESNNNTKIDADAVLVMHGQKYNIHSGTNTADYHSLTSTSTCVVNNYKLINNKGHFNPNTGYSYFLTDLAGNQAPYGLCTRRVNGKDYFVLTCGKNSFSMDDVMCGNVPFNQINGNVNNPYAIYRTK